MKCINALFFLFFQHWNFYATSTLTIDISINRPFDTATGKTERRRVGPVIYISFFRVLLHLLMWNLKKFQLKMVELFSFFGQPNDLYYYKFINFQILFCFPKHCLVLASFLSESLYIYTQTPTLIFKLYWIMFSIF